MLFGVGFICLYRVDVRCWRHDHNRCPARHIFMTNHHLERLERFSFTLHLYTICFRHSCSCLLCTADAVPCHLASCPSFFSSCSVPNVLLWSVPLRCFFLVSSAMCHLLLPEGSVNYCFLKAVAYLRHAPRISPLLALSVVRGSGALVCRRSDCVWRRRPACASARRCMRLLFFCTNILPFLRYSTGQRRAFFVRANVRAALPWRGLCLPILFFGRRFAVSGSVRQTKRQAFEAIH